LHTVGNVPHAPVVVFLGNPRVPGKKLGVKLEKVKLNPVQVIETRKERDDQLDKSFTKISSCLNGKALFVIP
jgi:hypothetical protein